MIFGIFIVIIIIGRHINHLRSMAYKEPTRRAFWLKVHSHHHHRHSYYDHCQYNHPKQLLATNQVWYSSIEKVESDDPWALAFDESQEEIARTL